MGRIRRGERTCRIGRSPQFAAKLSGVVTGPTGLVEPRDLRPFVGSVVDWFGVGRLMFGSDWPVCLLATSYEASSADLRRPSERSRSATRPASSG